MKDKILVTHPVLGIITIEDVIQDLENMLTDDKIFEDIVYQLLKQGNMLDEDIASLFNYSVKNRINWLIDILKSIL